MSRDRRYIRCLGRARKQPRDAYGEWLVFLRTTKGLTQEEVQRQLCQKLGMSSLNSRILAHWEGTGKLPGRELLIALAEIYQVNLETLLAVEKHPNAHSYHKRDKLIEQARSTNEKRKKQIKETNRDPHLE